MNKHLRELNLTNAEVAAIEQGFFFLNEFSFEDFMNAQEELEENESFQLPIAAMLQGSIGIANIITLDDVECTSRLWVESVNGLLFEIKPV